MLEVLAAGVTGDFLDKAAAKGYDVGSRNQKDKVAESAKKMQAELPSLKSTNFTRFAFDPEDPATLDNFTKLLKEKEFGVISLGGGVRTIPEVSHVFTQMVNIAKKEQPKATFIFPLMPDEVIPALKMHVPEAS